MKLPLLKKITFVKKGSKPPQLTSKKGKRQLVITIDKRQKFVIAVFILSTILFASQYQFARLGVVVSIIMAIVTNIFLYWAVKNDLKENFSWSVFLLPFFYSLSFSLFYFLIPARLLFRLILTSLYAFGLYSLFLSQNIFIVSSIRTIALLSGARIVSFVITLISYFFLTNTLFTLHLTLPPMLVLLGLYTFPLIMQSIWTYTLQKSVQSVTVWVAALTLCILEAGVLLWFWPSNPTVTALFLTGFFYTIVGLSHIWFDKRLFRGVLWEYVWVGVTVFFVLLLFTSWGK
ncbi:MAG: hypothetical protein QG600_284 [Patescibacteria group bacterium]|nr:hypothetical protein [Patescibacteria group bacterium]